MRQLKVLVVVAGDDNLLFRVFFVPLREPCALRCAIPRGKTLAITPAVLLSPGFNGHLDAPKASLYCVSLYRRLRRYVNNKTHASHENYNQPTTGSTQFTWSMHAISAGRICEVGPPHGRVWPLHQDPYSHFVLNRKTAPG
jgi:hypothetical protein